MRKVQNQVIEAVLEKMNRIIIRTREPFIEQLQYKDGKVSWIHRKYKLTDNIIRSHIKGERTVGTFYFGNATTFLFFDIDVEGDIQGQKSRVSAIISELIKYGLKKEDIHIMFSGCKGYHIQLFFDNPVPIKRVAAFGKKIIKDLGDLAEGIELRPENINGRGVRLPLAFHKKSQTFAYYVEKNNMESVPDSIDYFLQISPFSYEVIKNACDMALSKENTKNQTIFEGLNATLQQEKQKKQEKQEKQELNKAFTEMELSFNDRNILEKRAKQLLDKGLKQAGTRHKSQFILVLYYKGQGLSAKDAIQKISNWVTEQWKNKKTNEFNLEVLKKEVERNVKYIYEKEDFKGLYRKRGRNLMITQKDIDLVKKQEKKSARKALLALLMIGKIYHIDGKFSADMVSLGKLVGFSRQTVSIILREFMTKGIIEQVADYMYSEKLARSYYMPHLNKKGAAIIKFKGLTLHEAFQDIANLIEENVKNS